MSCQSFSRNIGPALIAWFLLLSLTSLYLFFICWDFSRQTSYALIAVHSLLIFYVVSTFGRATFMDPGYLPIGTQCVPGEKMTTIEKGAARTVMYKSVEINGIATRLKWCVTCEIYRPPRCSHCSICKHCIDVGILYCLNSLLTLDVRSPLSLVEQLYWEKKLSVLLCLSPFFDSAYGDDVRGICFVRPYASRQIVYVSGHHCVTSKYDLDMNPYNRGCCINWLHVFCKAEGAILIRPTTNLEPNFSRYLKSPKERANAYVLKSPPPGTDPYTSNQHAFKSGEYFDGHSQSATDATTRSEDVDHLNQLQKERDCSNDTALSLSGIGASPPVSASLPSPLPPATTSVEPSRQNSAVLESRTAKISAPHGFTTPETLSRAVLAKPSASELPRSVAHTSESPVPLSNVDFSRVANGLYVQSDTGTTGYLSMAGDQSTPLLMSSNTPEAVDNLSGGRKFRRPSNLLYTTYEQQWASPKLYTSETHPPPVIYAPHPPIHGSGVGRDSSRDLPRLQTVNSNLPLGGKAISAHPSSSLCNLREKPYAPVTFSYLPTGVQSTGDRHLSPSFVVADLGTTRSKFQQSSPKSRSRSAPTRRNFSNPRRNRDPDRQEQSPFRLGLLQTFSGLQMAPSSNIAAPKYAIKGTDNGVHVADAHRSGNRTLISQGQKAPDSSKLTQRSNLQQQQRGLFYQYSSGNVDYSASGGQLSSMQGIPSWPPAIPPHGAPNIGHHTSHLEKDRSTGHNSNRLLVSERVRMLEDTDIANFSATANSSLMHYPQDFHGSLGDPPGNSFTNRHGSNCPPPPLPPHHRASKSVVVRKCACYGTQSKPRLDP
ncbi:LOW QUALITY PROTEIN: hypothetical protein T265_13138 [Opisthorchis viverrini]|uniref:Palmitoyltransferase n=1 Tax=Opisthorchis viverrini TaxID=6198 RepID=A0A075AHX0_OPIVI|nr:LOW QUALITY PROTEIN: hypothetical protein T265_13138 [Opisthorchis viverrini]KER30619.1 LOW QUALITY PROTEIN: hypothetical protein T265_13138 [Opisthorchis viverrini]